MRKNSIKNTRINGEVQKELSTDHPEMNQRSSHSSNDFCHGCGSGS